MGNTHASTISTAGEGFGNEDAVGAQAVLCLLAQRQYLDAALGSPTAVRFQTGKLEWTLDDLLVESRSSLGVHRAAVSIKLNEPVKTTGFPKDFVHRCWQLALEPGSSGFDPNLDRLVLASSQPTIAVQTALSHLLKFADGDPDAYAGDLGSALGETLFRSFACPADLAAVHKERPPVARLLAAVRVLTFDFRVPNSSSQKDCLALCRGVVEGGAAEDADRLWTELQQYVKELRPARAKVTFELVLRRLRLKGHRLLIAPDYRPAWDHLTSLSARNLSDIRDVIGDKVHLERPQLQEDLRSTVARGRVTVLLGRSGVGKSAALKALVASSTADRPSFFLTAEDVKRLETHPLEAGVRYPLSKLPATQTAADAVLVLDGLDRLFEDAAITAVRRLIQALRLHSKDTQWRLVVSCQPLEWERVVATLPEIPECTPFDLRPLGGPELTDLLAQAPELAPLLSMTKGPLLFTLKALDLVVRSRTKPSPAWVGDADALTAWWAAVIGSDPQALSLERSATRIGRMQAETRNRFVAMETPDSGDVDALRTLQRHAIVTVKDGLVSFEHPLIGDYARARYLKGLLLTEDSTLQRYLDRPEWRSALQMLAAMHLEASARTGTHEEVTRLLTRIPGDIGIDLVCDAAVSASYSDRVLPALDPHLSAVGFLHRLLLRVWANVTSPVGLQPSFAKGFSLRERLWWDAEARVPVEPLWKPVIKWLLTHRAAIRSADPLTFASIANAGLDWAQRVGLDVPLQDELAGAILDIASDFREDRFRRGVDEMVLQRLFMTALLGARFHPGRFEKLARELSGLVVPPVNPATTAKADVTDADPPPWFAGDGRASKPWPDGPVTRPHRTFREAVLSPYGAYELAKLDPKLAQTLFLALLITPPGRPHSYSGRDDLQIEGDEDGPPPCHDFAPLQALLEVDPNVALEFLTRLIDFATDRYVETRQASPSGRAEDPVAPTGPGLLIRIDGSERLFRGDTSVFAWHGGAWLHSVVGSALMTLEHHLFSIAKTERDRIIQQLLRRSHSVAILGVLAELAVAEPALLDASLRPLLDDPDILRFAQAAHSEVFSTPVPTSWPQEPGERALLRQAWKQLPRHQTDLYHAFIEWLRLARFDWSPLSEIRARWLHVRETRSKVLRAFYDDLLYMTDPSNWGDVRGPDGKVTFYLKDSAELQAERRELERQADAMLPLNIAVRCQRFLEGDESLSPREIGELTAVLDTSPRSPTKDSLLDVASLPGIAAATLLARADASLALNPDVRHRCEALVLEMVLTPSAPGPLDSRRSPCLGCWDFFAARAIPVMLTRHGLTPSLRRALATTALAPHNQAIEWCLSRVVGDGELPWNERDSLLHLVVFAARLMFLRSWATTRLPPLAEACREELDRIQQRYLHGRLAPLPERWSTIASFVPRGRRLRTRYRLWRRRKSLAPIPARADYDLLRAAFAWIASDLDGLAPEECPRRAAYLLELRHALGIVAQGDNDADQSWHFESHRLVGRGAAALLLSMSDSAQRQALMGVLFTRKQTKRRGYATEESIIKALFRFGLLSGGEHQLFRRVHCELFERCFGSEIGVLLPDTGRSEVRDLAQCFLGVGVGHLDEIWAEERVGLFEALDGTWRRWIAVSFARWGCGTAFLRLLRSPAAKTRRMSLLGLIGPEGLEDPGDASDFDLALLDLLQLCWEEHSSALECDEASRDAFQRCLRRLVKRGLPGGLLLEQRVASRWAPH